MVETLEPLCARPNPTRNLTVSDRTARSEYLVISRGRWDASATPDGIQGAIDRFYVWHEQMVGEGKMKTGQRLAQEGMRVSREGVTDGPYTEAKEMIGGYWFILASSLAEAAAWRPGNRASRSDLSFEIRPTEAERASAFQ